jgi:hypothetical protein
VSPVVSAAAGSDDFSVTAWRFYLRRSLRLMLECEAVAMLPGWSGSRGALLEVDVAAQVGLEADTVEGWCVRARTAPQVPLAPAAASPS